MYNFDVVFSLLWSSTEMEQPVRLADRQVPVMGRKKLNNTEVNIQQLKCHWRAATETWLLFYVG